MLQKRPFNLLSKKYWITIIIYSVFTQDSMFKNRVYTSTNQIDGRMNSCAWLVDNLFVYVQCFRSDKLQKKSLQIKEFKWTYMHCIGLRLHLQIPCFKQLKKWRASDFSIRLTYYVSLFRRECHLTANQKNFLSSSITTWLILFCKAVLVHAPNLTFHCLRRSSLIGAAPPSYKAHNWLIIVKHIPSALSVSQKTNDSSVKIVR